MIFHTQFWDTPSVPVLSNFQGNRASHSESGVIFARSLGPEQVQSGSGGDRCKLTGEASTTTTGHVRVRENKPEPIRSFD